MILLFKYDIMSTPFANAGHEGETVLLARV